MKISINMKEISGPWGGGNNFYKSIKSFAKFSDVEIVNHLSDSNIDLVLIICNLNSSTSASYSVREALNYCKEKDIPIVQRINECDERKNTKNVNLEIIEISKKVDKCVFVSDWLKDQIFGDIEKNKKLTIRNGANNLIFSKKKITHSKKKKINIVTHHFSNNISKGYDIYGELNKILEDDIMSKKFHFTIIGNHPKNLNFNNTTLIKVMTTSEISEELKKYDLYITASINEPGPNHVVEALSSGLPVLYLNSGSMEEYVSEFGVKFSKKNFVSKLNFCHENIDLLEKKLEKYDYSSEIMCKKYFELFRELIDG